MSRGCGVDLHMLKEAIQWADQWCRSLEGVSILHWAEFGSAASPEGAEYYDLLRDLIEGTQWRK